MSVAPRPIHASGTHIVDRILERVKLYPLHVRDHVWLTWAEFDEFRISQHRPLAQPSSGLVFGRRILIVDRFEQ